MENKFVERKRTAFLGLPLYFTTYSISDEMIQRKRGLLKIEEDNVFMYKVQDVRVSKTLMERIFKLGTIICYSGDVTDPEFRFEHIKHCDEIKEFIMHKSEEERLRRRTVNMMDINTHMEDIGYIDN